MTGRVVIENAKAPLTDRERRARMHVYAEPVTAELGMPGAVVELQGEGQADFAIRGLLAGEYYFMAETGGVVKSVQWNGRDYSDEPFDASAGHDFTDVVVIVTTERVGIAGTVRDALGVPVSAAAVICFPSDPSLWDRYGLFPRRLGSVLADDAGAFMTRKLGSGIGGLPAGDYSLVAVDEAYATAWQNRAFLAAASRVATRVRVGWGETARVNLRLQEIKVP